ncbi:helix-turn-helix domain-containing protein [Bacillus sp. FJAT-27245]|uniref:helix-turn-helix domain-containing protein n=1 Tax=Bacillus sp. FJAT-27245 TaxID=1684144 RepID=UPI0006A79B91|nr:helix-turn-helix domain-containing protein [Bacillus sp. FJAT-27245]
MQNVDEKPGILFFDVAILYCLGQLKGERTIYSIYHLLKGKKSAQTIQDAHLFSLTALFMAHGNLAREHIEDAIQRLNGRGLIREVCAQRYILTDKGGECLEAELAMNPLPPDLQGWKYHLGAQHLWERLSLLVQVCSHIARKETRYVPVQKKRHTQLWIKSFLGGMELGQREALPGVLYRELSSVLGENENINPDVLVLRLTGFQSAGLTPQQAAMELGMDEFRFHLEFLAILHYICKKAGGEKGEFPLLRHLLSVEGAGTPLTLTSRQTLKFLNKGMSIDSIAAARGLKRSTIEDHIVEIALNVDGFSIDPFVEPEEQNKIISLAKHASTRQLKELRDLSGGLSYFKIRLVLAKLGEGK